MLGHRNIQIPVFWVMTLCGYVVGYSLASLFLPVLAQSSTPSHSFLAYSVTMCLHKNLKSQKYYFILSL